MNIIIREVGDKLKELRRRLGLNQEEMVKIVVKKNKTKDKPFTRNLISMVETGKSPMTKNLAETIKVNLDIICEERGIKKDFDFDEICKTPKEQVEEYIDEFLNKISQRFTYDNLYDYSEELIALAEKYKLYLELCKVYICLGRKIRDDNTDKSLEYYLKAYALKSELTKQEILILSTNVKYLYLRKKKYQEAVNITCDFEGTTKASQFRCLFNDATCLKMLGKFDAAVEIVKGLKKLSKFMEKQDEINIYILEADILADKSEYTRAMRGYEELLKKDLTIGQERMLKFNLIDIKSKIGLSIEDDIEQLSTDDEDSDIVLDVTEGYFVIAEGCKKKNFKKAEEYYVLAIESVIKKREKINNDEFYNKSVEALIKREEDVDSERGKRFELIKAYVISGIELELIEEKTLYRSMLYFLNIDKQEFVNDILRAKIG